MNTRDVAKKRMGIPIFQTRTAVAAQSLKSLHDREGKGFRARPTMPTHHQGWVLPTAWGVGSKSHAPCRSCAVLCNDTAAPLGRSRPDVRQT